MSTYPSDQRRHSEDIAAAEPRVVVAELVPEFSWQRIPDRPLRPRRIVLPLVLFVATCLSTLWAGWIEAVRGADLDAMALGNLLRFGLVEGLKYAVPLMTILVFHEMGHFLQARRYGIPASLPYFIPMPISPIGTFGAVISMSARMGHRRALFDIGITGPLAGLFPTLVFCVLGLQWSEAVPAKAAPDGTAVGVPLVFSYLAEAVGPSRSPGDIIVLHPMAFAGWVGLLITSINLFPIGQLDGGHVLYALLRERAGAVASLLLVVAMVAVLWYRLFGWMLMLLLLIMMGPKHPPTADDDEPLGLVRHLLGWATLAMMPLGFTPTPFLIE